MENVLRENAAKLGQSIAEVVSSGKLPLTPEQVQDIVDHYQVKVIVVPVGDQQANPRVRAIYDCRRRWILIEETSLQSLQLACESGGLGPVSRRDVLAMHLAHELFHHLEEIAQVPQSLYYRCDSRSGPGKLPFFLNLKQTISRFYTNPPLIVLREIAAHSFVTALLGLNVSPAWIENGALQGRDTIAKV